MNAKPIYVIFVTLLTLAFIMIALGTVQSSHIGQSLGFIAERVQDNKTLTLSTTSPLSSLTLRSPKFPFRVEGHRGAGTLEPANTIKSYKRAIELELDGIEIDIWLTKDGVPVIAHNNISRYGDIEYITLKQRTQEEGKYLLSLAEVLEVCKDKINLNIELKDPQEAIVEKVLDLLIEKNALDQVTLSSFYHYHREILTREVIQRNLSTKVSFGFLMNHFNVKFPDYTKDTQTGDFIVVDFQYLVKKRKQCLDEINRARRYGLKVSFWFYTGFKKESMHYDDLIDLGVDTIVTNYPLEVLKYFEGRKTYETCEDEVNV